MPKGVIYFVPKTSQGIFWLWLYGSIQFWFKWANLGQKKIDEMDQFGSVWGGLIQLNTRLQNNPIPDSGWL